VVALIAGIAACPTVPGSWSVLKTLEATFGVSSPPEPALVSANGSGHTLAVWDATGIVRYAERSKGAAWSLSKPVVLNAIGQFPVAAIGDDDTVAVAWVTVATEFTPAYVVATVRAPGGSFPAPAQVALGSGVYDLNLGVANDGTATLVWSAPGGIFTATRPPAGAWATAVQLSASGVGAGLPDLIVSPAGAALAVWQQGTAGNPTTIGTAYRAAGGDWEAPRVLPSSGAATWNPKPAIDHAGNVAVGYLGGNAMVVATRAVSGDWSAPEVISPAGQAAYYPALAMDGSGDLIAAWQALDAGNYGSVYQRSRASGASWGLATLLSAPSEDAGWPSLAYSGDGSVAVVSWVDNSTNEARASVGSVTALWSRSLLGSGWWGATVPVAAGGGTAVATWATVVGGNPNAASLVAKTYE
jgi:hypothetical protein